MSRESQVVDLAKALGFSTASSSALSPGYGATGPWRISGVGRLAIDVGGGSDELPTPDPGWVRLRAYQAEQSRWYGKALLTDILALEAERLHLRRQLARANEELDRLKGIPP